MAGCAEEVATPDGKSTELARDLDGMWETEPLESSGDPTHPPAVYLQTWAVSPAVV